MKNQVLHTLTRNISGEASGEIWNRSLLGVKGLESLMFTTFDPRPLCFSVALIPGRQCGLNLIARMFDKVNAAYRAALDADQVAQQVSANVMTTRSATTIVGHRENI